LKSKEIKQLAICDSDTTYLALIQAYLSRKNLMDFEIRTFGTVKSAIEKSMENGFEILLIGEKTYEDDVKNIRAKKIFILQEDGESAVTEYEMVAKYQSMGNLVANVLEKYASDEKCESNIKCGRNKTSLITFYSPQHHPAQSMSALAMAQLLADKGEKVLYLNLHGFSGFEELINISYDADITDFMYFVLKHSEKLLYKLESMKRSIRGVDYLPPALDFSDLVNIKPEEWKKAIDLVLYSGDYTHIIVDLSENCQGFYEILDKSDKVYILYNDNSMYGQASLGHFMRLLRAKEWNGILDKVTTFSVPYETAMRDISPESLALSEIGVYMRGVISEQI
jgi:hypothetical protein